MDLKRKLETALHDAMRNHDEPTKDTIRIILSSIKLLEIENRKELDDLAIATLLQKEIKIRNETVLELADTKRLDLISKAKNEMEILKLFLPEQITEEKLTEIVDSVIKSESAVGPSDMGRVMKILVPQLQGKASADQISTIVKKFLLKQ
jgi:uncharacterized protein